jgi:hypothetical protein
MTLFFVYCLHYIQVYVRKKLFKILGILNLFLNVHQYIHMTTENTPTYRRIGRYLSSYEQTDQALNFVRAEFFNDSNCTINGYPPNACSPYMTNVHERGNLESDLFGRFHTFAGVNWAQTQRCYQFIHSRFAPIVDIINDHSRHWEHQDDGQFIPIRYVWHYLPTQISKELADIGIDEQSLVPYHLLDTLADVADVYIANVHGNLYPTEDGEYVTYCERCEEYFLTEDTRYVDDPGCELCHECADQAEDDEDYNENDSRQTRDYINHYHNGPSPKNYYKDPSTTLDLTIPGLSKFSIGFEIEKERVDRHRGPGSPVERQPLFSHWETDSSCGVEGVTNVYNLADYEFFKSHVNASDYVDEMSSNNCGGHTNIAFNGTYEDGFTFDIESCKNHTGILYALFKKRLMNDYSRYNKKLRKNADRNRYCCIVEKNNPSRLEFRIPSRIKNKKQLLRRFKLFQVLLAHIYSYHMHKDKYISTMHTINSRLDLQFGRGTLYRNLRADDFINSSFLKSETYKLMRFIVHDLTQYLEVSYKDRSVALASTVIDAYKFQAWLDDNDGVNLTDLEFLRFISDNRYDNPSPKALLTVQQRCFFNDVDPAHRINNISYYSDNTQPTETNVLNNT